MEDIGAAFSAIYERNDWAYGSGPGSLPRNTISYRGMLERFIADNSVRTVTDLGCGDWQFSKHIDWSSVSYTGIDVVHSLVEKNMQLYARPNITFKHLVKIDDLPGGDLIVAKEVLQHLPNSLVHQYLEAFRQRYRFAIVTNTVAPSFNLNNDIPIAGVRPLKIMEAPFGIKGSVLLTYGFATDGTYFENEAVLLIGDVQPSP